MDGDTQNWILNVKPHDQILYVQYMTCLMQLISNFQSSM